MQTVNYWVSHETSIGKSAQDGFKAYFTLELTLERCSRV